MSTTTVHPSVDYTLWVGKKVTKSGLRSNTTPKPFKSKLQANTVKEVTVSPYTGKPGFLFEEDDSIVDCHVCKLVVT